ncbi:Cysteine desulfurase IscS 2 [uncultured archaeon]|nr:Cysteine desulfurase IscS 2 [uncultured archaeon]
MRKIYMDYAATTPVRKEVLKAMMPYFMTEFGNASSLHSIGQSAAEAVEFARSTVASAIGANPEEIIFTSGGTEADNLAIRGIAKANRDMGDHIITSAIEHPAVRNTCADLAKEGFKITFLSVDKDGLIDPVQVRKAITTKTVLITIMHANNEIGTVQPTREIGRIAKENGVLFHTDAVQTFGKLPIDVDGLNVDMLTMSAHKIGGPKGVGALYVRKGTQLKAMQTGGPHEGNRRAGTENVAGIVGFAKAAELSVKEMGSESARLSKLRDRLIKGVLSGVKEAQLNGHPTKRLPNNANFSFLGAEGEAIILKLDALGIEASTGSACSSHDLAPSHVLLALGHSPLEAHGSLRITLGKETAPKDVECVIRVIPKVIKELRAISPDIKEMKNVKWADYKDDHDHDHMHGEEED